MATLNILLSKSDSCGLLVEEFDLVDLPTWEGWPNETSSRTGSSAIDSSSSDVRDTSLEQLLKLEQQTSFMTLSPPADENNFARRS